MCMSLPGLVFAFLAALSCSGITLNLQPTQMLAVFWEGCCGFVCMDHIPKRSIGVLVSRMLLWEGVITSEEMWS